jgi:hypothetical protein
MSLRALAGTSMSRSVPDAWLSGNADHSGRGATRPGPVTSGYCGQVTFGFQAKKSPLGLRSQSHAWSA